LPGGKTRKPQVSVTLQLRYETVTEAFREHSAHAPIPENHGAWLAVIIPCTDRPVLD
jgi:hypothetical protein